MCKYHTVLYIKELSNPGFLYLWATLEPIPLRCWIWGLAVSPILQMRKQKHRQSQSNLFKVTEVIRRQVRVRTKAVWLQSSAAVTSPWTEWLFPQNACADVWPQGDGVWRWGLREVTRFRWGREGGTPPPRLHCCLYKKRHKKSSVSLSTKKRSCEHAIR